MASHYSNVQQAEILSRRSEEWARAIMKLCKKRNGVQVIAPVLVYTGLSGTGSATALSLAFHRLSKGRFRFGMIYCRKPNENSHGSNIETNLDDLGKLQQKLVFVDDFISSGDSYVRAMITAVMYQYRGTIGQLGFDASKTWIVEMSYEPESSFSKRSDANGRFMQRLNNRFKEFEKCGDPEYDGVRYRLKYDNDQFDLNNDQDDDD